MKREINYSAEFIGMAERGAEVYYMNALYWLSDALMKFYEFPKYYTVLYRASEGWGLKLRKSKHPLAFNAMCQPIMELFKYANPRYDHEYSNPLLLETMSNEEVYRLCEEMIANEINGEKELCEVLCAGLKMVFQSNMPMNHYQFCDLYFTPDEHTFYQGYVFKTRQLTNLKLHVFREEGIMSDFHFVIDFLKYLATDELHLVYQCDAKKDLKLTGKLCSWDGYEMIADSLKDRFNCVRYPLEEMTFFYIKDIDMRLYKWDKTTIKELMAVRGLTPHERYANYIERSHKITINRAS